jgi:hypothetical protein
VSAGVRGTIRVVGNRKYGIAVFLSLVYATVGCAASRDGVRVGEPMTHVQADLGRPDVISDSSGDEVIFYTPYNRPPDEWPWSAPRTFYYLGRDLEVTFERGRVTSVQGISASRRKMLEDLVARHPPPQQRSDR